VDNMKTLIFVT